MPANHWQTSFTAGEVTERLLARTDVAKYAHAAKCIKNAVPQPHGGAARRAGTIFLGGTKDYGQVRLVPFQFNVEQAYMLEFGDEYIRVWANRAPVTSGGDPIEIASPYTVEDLPGLRWDQSADVLYLAHPSYAPRKLSRISATSFVLSTISFLPPPTAEIPVAPATTLTLSAATVGTGRTATAGAASFLEGDVGRQLKSGAGRAVITAFTSTTQVTVTILDAFAGTSIASGAWTMDGSPNAGVLTFDRRTPRFAEATMTSTLDAFRATDVGKYVIAHNSVTKIVAVSSATVALGQILQEDPVMDDDTDTPDAQVAIGLWTLEGEAWSETRGYPGVVHLHADQRLYWAGSPSQPDTVWGSVVGDYEAHGGGTLDDAAVEFIITGRQVNAIRWMRSAGGKLVIGTSGGEFTMEGGNDEPITPTNIRVRDWSNHGATETIDAIPAANALVFVQRSARKVREFTEDPDSVFGGYVAPDLTILAEHLTRDGLTEIAYAEVPEQMIFAVRSDGVLPTLTYERRENVVAWAHQETDGDFESIAVIPNMCGSQDEVWVSVVREIEDAERRYIEVFDGGVMSDSALVYEGDAIGVFGGADHLEGKAARVRTANGNVYNITVADGTVTLPDSETTTLVEIGLPYVSTIQPLRPELALATGTLQARRQRVNQVAIRWHCLEGTPYVNGEPVTFPTGATFPYTGDTITTIRGGWGRGEDWLTIQMVEPKPGTVLGVRAAIQAEDA